MHTEYTAPIEKENKDGSEESKDRDQIPKGDAEEVLDDWPGYCIGSDS